MILVTGGARSGKSRFAESLAQDLGKQIVYIATAIAFDEEMQERIQKHQDRRPKEWKTIEAYCDLEKQIEKYEKADVFLLDCVTIMVTNLMFAFSDGKEPEQSKIDLIEDKILKELRKTIDIVRYMGKEIIFVTNEIGMGIVPENQLSRQFRDIAGRANQMLAQEAEQVYFLISGIPLQIKGKESR